MVGLNDVKWKESKLPGYWADCMTLPFDHTHDLDLEVSRSGSEIALFQEWDGRLTWNKKDVIHPIMAMILTSANMVVGAWIYWIVNGLTSDIGVPSTYLVYWHFLPIFHHVSCMDIPNKFGSQKIISDL